MLGVLAALIVVDAVHDDLVDMVVERTAALEIGPPSDDYAVGPVVSAAQHRSVLEEIDRGRSEAELVHGGHAVDLDGGWYIEPTVFDGVEPSDRLGRHEIFGPVLSVISADDFEEALAIANDTEFGLTGGLFSTDENRIERARRRVPRGQSVHQPQDHRCAGRDPALRRVQAVGIERQGRRARLPEAVHRDEVGHQAAPAVTRGVVPAR